MALIWGWDIIESWGVRGIFGGLAIIDGLS